MKKNIFTALMFAFVATIFASCTDENDFSSNFVDPANVKFATNQSQLQSRLVFVTHETEKAGIRAAKIKKTQAPAIPSTALKLSEQPTNWNNGVMLTPGNAYYIDEEWQGTISRANGDANAPIDIYVNANATFKNSWWTGDATMNIYILPNAVLTYCEAGNDNKVKIPNKTSIYCWGNIVTEDYTGNGNPMGFQLYQGGSLYIYDADAEPFEVVDNKSSYGSSFQIDTESYFYSEREVIIYGRALFNGGKAHFANKLTVANDMYVEKNTEITLDDCAYVLKELDFKSATGAVVNVNKYLRANTLLTNQGTGIMNLKDALFEIVQDGMFVDKGDQKIVVNGVTSKYKSVVKVGGKLYLDRGNEYTTVPGDVAAASFPSGNFTGDLNLEGELRIKFYYNVPDEKAILTEDNLTLPETVSVHANSWLPASEDGCRPETGTIPVIEILPPNPADSLGTTVSHKYSATGIAFKDNMVYICWHSNPETNMQYGEGNFSPSVDGEDDFGGIIDVINIGIYDIRNTLFEQSMENKEFKYNHIIYTDNKLYSAATNLKIGAALSKIELTADGKFPESEEYKEVRINLTGYSANCVERVGDELVTISGYSNGGINKFAIDDESSQEKKFINQTAEDFQGKYVYYNKNNNKVVTLNNMSKGIVTIYDRSMQAEKSFEVGEINPTDGKNVCICDNDYIYICKGRNGFVVYNYDGTLVGGSKSKANGVDVDENHIYLAAGNGLVILDKHSTYVDKDGNTYNRTIKKFHYTGKGATNVTDETTIKHSANFVKKGPDGRIYVAYGMYGLQIYELN